MMYFSVYAYSAGWFDSSTSLCYRALDCGLSPFLPSSLPHANTHPKCTHTNSKTHFTAWLSLMCLIKTGWGGRDSFRAVKTACEVASHVKSEQMANMLLPHWIWHWKDTERELHILQVCWPEWGHTILLKTRLHIESYTQQLLILLQSGQKKSVIFNEIKRLKPVGGSVSPVK